MNQIKCRIVKIAQEKENFKLKLHSFLWQTLYGLFLENTSEENYKIAPLNKYFLGISPTRKGFEDCCTYCEKIGRADSKELLQVFDIRGSAVTRYGFTYNVNNNNFFSQALNKKFHKKFLFFIYKCTLRKFASLCPCRAK